MRTKHDERKAIYLRNHYELVLLLYVVASFFSILILSLPDAQKNLVTLLSTGAIFASFGSAIGTIGLVWQSDLLNRVKLNIDILNRDIMKIENQWRRWPFLPRFTKKQLLNDNSLHMNLNNPEIPLDVGTHTIKITLPTVLEDFYDLPLFQNYCPLVRFRNAAHTTFGRKQQDKANAATGLKPFDEYMAYECMYDIWKSVLKFRIARYVLHFGSGLTMSGALTVTFYLVMKISSVRRINQLRIFAVTESVYLNQV